MQSGRTPDSEQTREKLIAAGEELFARHGIHRVRLRELYDLAGQRNSSALHYHFGSRLGLVEAILLAHQTRIDEVIKARLDELEADTSSTTTLRGLLESVIPAMAEQLYSPSGRNFLRIVPQILDALSDNLRAGKLQPTTPQSRRLLDSIASLLPDLPEALKRERVVTYVITLTSLLAERAHHLETANPQFIDGPEFSAQLVAMIAAMLEARTGAEAVDTIS